MATFDNERDERPIPVRSGGDDITLPYLKGHVASVALPGVERASDVVRVCENESGGARIVILDSIGHATDERSYQALIAIFLRYDGQAIETVFNALVAHPKRAPLCVIVVDIILANAIPTRIECYQVGNGHAMLFARDNDGGDGDVHLCTDTSFLACYQRAQYQTHTALSVGRGSAEWDTYFDNRLKQLAAIKVDTTQLAWVDSTDDVRESMPRTADGTAVVNMAVVDTNDLLDENGELYLFVASDGVANCFSVLDIYALVLASQWEGRLGIEAEVFTVVCDYFQAFMMACDGTADIMTSDAMRQWESMLGQHLSGYPVRDSGALFFGRVFGGADTA